MKPLMALIEVQNTTINHTLLVPGATAAKSGLHTKMVFTSTMFCFFLYRVYTFMMNDIIV